MVAQIVQRRTNVEQPNKAGSKWRNTKNIHQVETVRLVVGTSARYKHVARNRDWATVTASLNMLAYVAHVQ